MKNITVQTIHWSKYLDERVNPRVKNFLKHRGDDVMWQVSLNVHHCIKHTKDKLVMIVHENAPYAINIPEEDYQDVLELSIKYFEKKEEYEKCAEILRFKDDVKNKRNSKVKKTSKNLI